MGTKPLIVLSIIILLGVFVFVSFRADFRLTDEMPAQFVSLDGVAPEQRANEESIARAYWNCARLVLTPKYNLAYNLPLPVEPPPEFNVSCENAGPQTALQRRNRSSTRSAAILETTSCRVVRPDMLDDRIHMG